MLIAEGLLLTVKKLRGQPAATTAGATLYKYMQTQLTSPPKDGPTYPVTPSGVALGVTLGSGVGWI